MHSVAFEELTASAEKLLCELIEIQSFSREEEGTATLLETHLQRRGLPVTRIGNNIICEQQCNQGRPLVVLNSHHDTVRPNDDWTYWPLAATVEGERITGLGSNDAGASLVSLLETFVAFYTRELPVRLMLIASCEEEISGPGGLRRVLQELSLKPALAIVGEPTATNLAIAEKGLLVIDATSNGKSGHAAHQVGDNAISMAVADIARLHNYAFEKSSELLGPVKLTVTQIEAGTQHNVVPNRCSFVIDCRVNEHYTNEQVLTELRELCESTLSPRSTHLNASHIEPDHALVAIGRELGKRTYGSPTLSDQVFFSCQSVKVGPGDSRRSHQADEYILRSELRAGIETYVALLAGLRLD